MREAHKKIIGRQKKSIKLSYVHPIVRRMNEAVSNHWRNGVAESKLYENNLTDYEDTNMKLLKETLLLRQGAFDDRGVS
jgi:hypothetical protein